MLITHATNGPVNAHKIFGPSIMHQSFLSPAHLGREIAGLLTFHFLKAC